MPLLPFRRFARPTFFTPNVLASRLLTTHKPPNVRTFHTSSHRKEITHTMSNAPDGEPGKACTHYYVNYSHHDPPRTIFGMHYDYVIAFIVSLAFALTYASQHIQRKRYAHMEKQFEEALEKAKKLAKYGGRA